MERKKYIIILFLLLAKTGVSQIHSNKTTIYNAYISGDMNRWHNAIIEMENQLNKSDAFLMELINYEYGYIAWCIGNDKKGKARTYLNLAKSNLTLLENKSYEMAWVYSYHSAFYGYEIGLNVFKAPFIGLKSINNAQIAMEIDPANPFGYIQYGNIQNYMPAAFGGSKTEAIEYYLKALRLMESEDYDITNDWNYLSLMITIGEAYSHIEDYQKASEFYKKILQIEPGFMWVKNTLYPETLKKINEQ
jgi:tetratricopeptide (TPR) repeat protein